ncbi:hypothetical protein EV361DRAFT_955740 [Lentinula raphanica]|nr:hypothetical protein EV361DRAFT_955740 [Lentinula raphanica]
MSPTLSSTFDSLDFSLTDSFRHLEMNTQSTCSPRLYESSNRIDDSTNSGKYRFYNVYAGDQPGIYKNWQVSDILTELFLLTLMNFHISRADASGRVTNVKGNHHKGYKTWAQALEGWKQNCSSYHHHPAGFVDGTPYSPLVRPETPSPMTPPPSRQNTEHFEAAAANPSIPSLPTPHHSMPHITTESLQYWAIRSVGFVGVVSSTSQAQAIADEAASCNENISLRLVDDLSEAEAWLKAPSRQS